MMEQTSLNLIPLWTWPIFLLVNRYWSKGCALLSCLLGLTWIVGVFVVNEDTIFMAYLFNIFNTLQVSYCLNLNNDVTSEYSSILGWDQSWTPLVAHLPFNPSQFPSSHTFYQCDVNKRNVNNCSVSLDNLKKQWRRPQVMETAN